MTNATTADSQASLLSWLLSRTRGVRGIWALGVTCRILNQLALIAVLVLAGRAVISASLSPYLGWIVALALARAALRYGEQYFGHWVAFTTLSQLRTEFYDSLVPQAPAVVKGSAASELSERATRDIDRIEVFFAHTVPPAISAITVTSIAVGAIGFTLGWPLATVVAIGSLAITCGPILARTLSWSDNQELASTHADLSIHLGDSLQGLREVNAFGAAEIRFREWEDLQQRAESLRRRIRIRAAVRAGLIVSAELLVLIICVGISRPDAGALAALTWIGLWPVLRGVDDFVDGLDEALASAERVRASVSAPPLVEDLATAIPPTTGVIADVTAENPLLKTRHVRFSYPDGTEVLKDISLDVSAGDWLFIAGVSGSGKSTLAALLARGWDPSDGQILFHDEPLSQWPLQELRHRISLVVQKPALLHTTLAENLRLGQPEATESQMWDALEVVDMGNWARHNPEGLHHRIATDGGNLSGGQIQRLAIARALLSNPEILILDEATSQLDESTAANIRTRIRAHRHDLTVIEISHQVDLIPQDAPVVVFDAGTVIEEGTSSSLLSDDGSALSRIASR